MPVPEGTSPGAPAPAAHPRCVLWHPAGIALPGELLTSLCKRNIRITACTDPYRAMAHACLLAHAAANESPAAPLIVLLVHPRQLEHAADVLSALATYAPSAACWQYEPSTHPALRPIAPGDVRSWKPAPAPPAAPAPQPPRAASSGAGAPAAGPMQAPTAPRAILTEAELTMLLAPDGENGTHADPPAVRTRPLSREPSRNGGRT